MSPSPQAISKIRERVAACSNWSKTDAEVLADLQAELVPNPIEAAAVGAPLDIDGLLAMLSPEQRKATFAHPALPMFVAAVRAGDRDAVRRCIALGMDAELFDSTVHDALLAAVDATVADPSHRTQISAVESEIGRPADLEDVAASRPEA